MHARATLALTVHGNSDLAYLSRGVPDTTRPTASAAGARRRTTRPTAGAGTGRKTDGAAASGWSKGDEGSDAHHPAVGPQGPPGEDEQDQDAGAEGEPAAAPGGHAGV